MSQYIAARSQYIATSTQTYVVVIGIDADHNVMSLNCLFNIVTTLSSCIVTQLGIPLNTNVHVIDYNPEQYCDCIYMTL